MESKKIENILLWIARGCMFAALLAPLVLGGYGINLAEWPKSMFFKACVELGLMFYVFLLLIDLKYLPKKSVLLLAVFLYCFAITISSIFGFCFTRSLLGDMQRGDGLVLQFHLLAFFVIISGIFRSKKDWIIFLRATAFVGLASALAGILQQAGLAKFYSVYQNAATRLSGTLSNPDLFASYMSLSAFIALFLFAAEADKRWKALWLAVFALDCYNLLFSGTRAGWLGAVCGFLILGVYWFLVLDKKKKKIAVLCLAGLAFFTVVFFCNLAWFESLPGGHIIGRITNLNMTDRLELWQIALQAAGDRPILGWGKESFSYISDKYDWRGLSGGIYYDRPHNKALEVLIDGGIIGFAAYMAIFGAAAYLLFKKNKNWENCGGNPKMLFGFILLGFFVCAFAQNFFGFDHISSYILFFAVLGFINSNFGDLQDSNLQKIRINFYLRKIFGILFLIFMAWVFYTLVGRPLAVGMNFPKYVVYENTNPEIAFLGYSKGISGKTVYDNEFRIAFVDRALYLIENGMSGKTTQKFLNKLLEIKPYLRQSIENNDLQVNHLYQYIARIDECEYFINKTPASLVEMEDILNKAMQFNPNVSSTCRLMGELKISQGEYIEAEDNIKKSCDLDAAECADISDLNQRMALSYYKFGEYQQAAEKYQLALDYEYSRTENLNSDQISENVTLADHLGTIYCLNLKDSANCKKIYDKASQVYPQYKSAFANRYRALAEQAQSAHE